MSWRAGERLSQVMVVGGSGVGGSGVGGSGVGGSGVGGSGVGGSGVGGSGVGGSGVGWSGVGEVVVRMLSGRGTIRLHMQFHGFGCHMCTSIISRPLSHMYLHGCHMFVPWHM